VGAGGRWGKPSERPPRVRAGAEFAGVEGKGGREGLGERGAK
jgi:hypothetical protein